MTGRETGFPGSSAPSPGRRIRKDYVILSFSSYEQAMEMEDFCRANGISGRLIPLPPKVHAGCGLCWRMDPEKMGPGKTGPGKTDSGETAPEEMGPGKTNPEETDPGKTAPEEMGSGKTVPGKTVQEGHQAAVRAAVDRIRAAGLIFEGPHIVSMWSMEN